MVLGKAQVLQSSTIRWQFVCDEGIWDKTLLFNTLRTAAEIDDAASVSVAELRMFGTASIVDSRAGFVKLTRLTPKSR